MNANIVQMMSRPPVNPSRGKNGATQGGAPSYNNNMASQQQIGAGGRGGAGARDYQSKSFVDQQSAVNYQQLKSQAARVNSDKKMASNSRTTHSQFSFHLNQNPNADGGLMPNGSWSSGHSTGQFGAASHTNSIGLQSHQNQHPGHAYPNIEQFGLYAAAKNQGGMQMHSQYNTIPHTSESAQGLEDQEAQVISSNWNSIHSRQQQPVTAQIKNLMGEKQAKLLKGGKQSSSLNRQMANLKGMEDGGYQAKSSLGYAAQRKAKPTRFISGNNRKLQGQTGTSLVNDAGSKPMNHKKLVGRVISHDGRTQQRQYPQTSTEQSPVNMYGQPMDPNQQSQEKELLLQLLQSKALNLSGDSSFNEILNYPPEQLKTLLELRGGKQLAQMYEDAVAANPSVQGFRTTGTDKQYSSLGSQSNYNLPLQVKQQNFMADPSASGGMPAPGGQLSSSSTQPQPRQASLSKAAQKELLNQYYRQKHIEENSAKEKEQQILEIIQTIKQETELRNHQVNLQNLAQQTFQPTAMANRKPGVGYGQLQKEQRMAPLQAEQRLSSEQSSEAEQRQWLQSLYAKINENYQDGGQSLAPRIAQLQKGIAEASREESSDDSDKKAENMINMLKQEVEQLKHQKGLIKQKSHKVIKSDKNDDIELADQVLNTEELKKHEHGVLQQAAAPKSWLKQFQNAVDPSQGQQNQQKQDRNMQIFDMSQKNSANTRDRNTKKSKNDLLQENMPQSRSLKTQDSATAILQQQYSKRAQPKGTEIAKQGQQMQAPNEIMINNDYDNDAAIQQKDEYDGQMATDKSIGDEQMKARNTRNKSNLSSKHERSQGSVSQRSASHTYRPASSNLTNLSQQAQNSNLVAPPPDGQPKMPEEFGSTENLKLPYSEGQSADPFRKDYSMANASNRFKRKTDNSAEASSKDLNKNLSSSSLRHKNQQMDPKQYSGLTFNNNSRIDEDSMKNQQEVIGGAQSNDLLAQYLIAGQFTPNQNIDGKDGMTPDSIDSLSQNNKSHQEILKLLHHQNKSQKSSDRNQQVSKTAGAVMRNRVQRQESTQMAHDDDQFTDLNINNNRSDVEKNSNQGQRIFQSSPLSSKKQLGDDSEQFNERLAALVANTDAHGRYSHELSYSNLNDDKIDENQFINEGSQRDNTLQLSGELLPKQIDRLVSNQQQSERNLLDSEDGASIGQRMQERQARSGGPFNPQHMLPGSAEIQLNQFENHLLQQFRDDSVKDLSVILDNDQSQQQQMAAAMQHQQQVNRPGPPRQDVHVNRNIPAQIHLPPGQADEDANQMMPTNIPSTQRQDLSGMHQGTLNPDNTAINILYADNQHALPAPIPAPVQQNPQSILQLLLDDPRFLSLLKKPATHDQSQQTMQEAQPGSTFQQIPSSSKATSACQTEASAGQAQTLSPFETYDLLFIRDLVNNLNYDNEVLHDNAQDLKAAFLFLQREHKQLQFLYQKEQRNAKLVELYRERTAELMKERDEAVVKAMQVSKKNEMLNDVMKLAVEQSQLMEAENEKLVEQLLEENKQLRSLLGIHREHNDQRVIEKGIEELEKLEKEQEARQAAANRAEEDMENDEYEQEIHESLLTHEQQIQRTQDDYLMLLREEHDMQFNQDIDEHKEILQRIYDEKLGEKTEEMEQEIHAVLTKQLTASISKDLKEKMADQMRNDVKAEVKEELRQEVADVVRREEHERATATLTEEINARVRQQLKDEMLAQFEQQYDLRLAQELAKIQREGGNEPKILASAERAADARNEMEQLKLLKQGSSLDSNNQTQNLYDYQQYLAMDQELSTPRDSEDFKETQGGHMGVADRNGDEDAEVNENDKTQKLFRETATREGEDEEATEPPYTAALSNSLPLPRTSHPMEQRQAADQLESALADSPQRTVGAAENNNSPSENWSESDGVKRSEGPSAESNGQGLGGTINKYNFDNIVFESPEEQELFNQLQQRESLGQNLGDRQIEERNLGSSLAPPEVPEEAAQIQSGADLPERQASQHSQAAPEQQTAPQGSQQRNNHHQAQGFQGQVLNRIVNQYSPNNQAAQSNGFESSPGQGLSRGGQIEGNSATNSSPNMQNSNRPVQQRQSQNQNQSNFGRGQGFQGQAISGASDVQQIMEQPMPQQEQEAASTRPVLLNNEPFELQQINRSPINQVSETMDLNEFKEIIEGLGENNQQRRAQLSADKATGQANGSSPPPTGPITLLSDPFGDQLEKEMQKNDAGAPQRGINFSQLDQQPINFHLEDDVFNSDKSISPIKSHISPPEDLKRKHEGPGTSALDRTDGLRSMLIAMNEEKNGDSANAQAPSHKRQSSDELDLDREEEKEEEYDYFLDPVKDEGGLGNKGYHLVDAADLEGSQDQKAVGKSKDDDLVDPDDEDLDKIQDEELREYRYNNMLEDLKESIEQEDEDKRKDESAKSRQQSEKE